jgi:hypothetical protein
LQPTLRVDGPVVESENIGAFARYRSSSWGMPMVLSWRPIIVSLITIVVAALLACALSALTALTSSEGFGYVFFKQLPAFLAGMLMAGIWCGCLLSYGMGVLAGHQQASANK